MYGVGKKLHIQQWTFLCFHRKHEWKKSSVRMTGVFSLSGMQHSKSLEEIGANSLCRLATLHRSHGGEEGTHMMA